MTEQGLNRLRWRCRRGLLENDLLLERYFEQAAAHMSEQDGQALLALMSLTDNDLLDLLLYRKDLSVFVDDLQPAMQTYGCNMQEIAEIRKQIGGGWSQNTPDSVKIVSPDKLA